MSLQRSGSSPSRVALLATIIAIGSQGRATAASLYVSTGSLNTIDSVNTANGAVTPLFKTPNPNPDDLITVGHGQILYLDQGTTLPEGVVAPATGQLRRHDFNTGADTVIAGGFRRPADLTLDPGGRSVVLTESASGTASGTGKVDRVNLSTGAVSVLASTGGGPNGVAYDNRGELFANLGARLAGPAGSFVAQLNPTTGAILGRTPGLNSADGLAFDSFSGRLFAASALSPTLYSINPRNLVDVRAIALPTTADGVISDGHGDLFIGGRSTTATSPARIFEYNVATGRITTVATIPGASSIDAAFSAPEPASVVLLTIGLLGVLGYGRFRRLGRTAA